MINIDKFDLVIDEVGKVVKWKGQTFHFHHYPLKNTYFANKGKDGTGWKAFHAQHGYTATTLTKIINKSLAKMWVSPLPDWAVGLCYRGKKIGWDKGKVKKVHSLYALLSQTIEDGNKHVLPFVFKEGKDTQQLKESFGKGAWKRICKQSFNRVKQITRIPRPLTKTDFDIFADPAYPSALLHTGLTDWGVIEWAKEKRVCTKLGKKWTRYRHYIKDSYLLAERLGKPLTKKDFPETLDGWKETHDTLKKEVNALQYSKNKWPHISELKWAYDPSLGFDVVLYDNAFDILTEGKEMHHCVAGYAEMVGKKKYLVFSIRKGGERHSTLGVRITESGLYMFDQHYKKYNQALEPNDGARIVASQIIDALNNGGEY